MILTKPAAKWLHDGIRKITPGVVVRGVILGIFLAAGTGIYLSLDSSTASEATGTSTEISTAYRVPEQDILAAEQSVEDMLTSETTSTETSTGYRVPEQDILAAESSVDNMLTYVYPEDSAKVKSPNKSVETKYRYMDLEDEPLTVEFLQTYVYPNKADHDRASYQQQRAADRQDEAQDMIRYWKQAFLDANDPQN